MRSAIRFPRRVRRAGTVRQSAELTNPKRWEDIGFPFTPQAEDAPADCPFTPDAPYHLADGLDVYRKELARFRDDMLTRARELDAMRRAAVGRSCFDLVDTVPGGGMALHTVAEKLMYGADLALPLRRVFDEAETNLLPLLAVARVLDSQEQKEGGDNA
ncbi:hypothetical protein [Mailhella massiliensis]|uniref:hypothetical protein n=1 Tax=Mailhella massiliensis TaxID=1903261 RepID=UPI001185BB62|nr:hypothetical protein [Mailhella massiliensis]